MLPNFLVVGAQKSGTTSFHHYLIEHPEIYLPEKKETKFFAYDHVYNKGIDYYETAFFGEWSGELAVGEVDPEYMYFEQAKEHIVQDLDLEQLKLIFILRNPIDRAFSHYLMTYRRGLEPLSFEEAIAAERERVSQGFQQKLHYSYISRGLYFQQIERFILHIDKSKMMFILTEDLNSDALGCLRRVFDFLGVRRDFVPASINRKFRTAIAPRSMALLQRIKGQGFEKKLVRFLIPWEAPRKKLRAELLEINQMSNHKMVLCDQTRKQLVDVFKDENNRLAEFIGRDLSHWK